VVQGNDLPKAVKGGRAGGSGSSVGHVPEEVPGVLKQFVFANAYLLHLPARMLDDCQVFARVCLPWLAAQGKPPPIRKISASVKGCRGDSHDRVVEEVVRIKQF